MKTVTYTLTVNVDDSVSDESVRAMAAELETQLADKLEKDRVIEQEIPDMKVHSWEQSTEFKRYLLSA